MVFSNVYKKEMKWNFISVIIWMSVFAGFCFLYIPLSDELLKQAEDLMKFLEKMPQFFLQMFNFEAKVISEPEGLFGSEGMSFVYILSAIYAAMLAGSIFSKEFENKTIEYLFVKPGKRLTYFFSKASAMYTYIVLLSSVFTISTIQLFAVFVGGDYSNKVLLGFGIYALAVQVFFGSIAVLISVFTKKGSLNTAISIGLTIFMYFGDSLGRSFDHLKWMAKISIFHYIPLADTVIDEKIFLGNSLIIMAIGGVVLLFSSWVFNNTDVSV
ncbi:MAG: ABC transporter permease subunit [Kosmotoga sp.]|nr:MAG: ABC transporter permease subunit [Kosmotoga sp.]